MFDECFFQHGGLVRHFDDLCPVRLGTSKTWVVGSDVLYNMRVHLLICTSDRVLLGRPPRETWFDVRLSHEASPRSKAELNLRQRTV